MVDHVKVWQQRVQTFETDSHRLFSKYETSASRVVELNALVKSLSGLPVDVEDYFREAADCVMQGSRRAAIVMAWAGFYSVFMDAFYAAKETEIKTNYKNWSTGSAEELRESVAEATLLKVAKKLRFLKNAKLRIYDGQLAIRNQCAHPTVFSPSQNLVIGFVDTMVSQTREYL